MLQVATKDRPHPNGVRHAGNPRSQTANASKNEINIHAGHRSVIQRLGDPLINQRVRLEHDPPLAAKLRFVRDQSQQLQAQVLRCNHEMAVRAHIGEAGQVVEQLANVLTDFLIRSE